MWARLHDADQKQKSKTQTHPSVADRDRDTLLHQGKTNVQKEWAILCLFVADLCYNKGEITISSD